MRRCLTFMSFLLFVTGPFACAQDAQSSGGAADITGAHPVRRQPVLRLMM